MAASLSACTQTDTIALPRDASAPEADALRACATLNNLLFCEDFDDPAKPPWPFGIIGEGQVTFDAAGGDNTRSLQAAVTTGSLDSEAAIFVRLFEAAPTGLHLSMDLRLNEVPPSGGGVLVAQVRVYPQGGESTNPNDSHNVELFVNGNTFAVKQIVPGQASPALYYGGVVTAGAWTHIDFAMTFTPLPAVDVRVNEAVVIARSPLLPLTRSGRLGATLGVVYRWPDNRDVALRLDNVQAQAE